MTLLSGDRYYQGVVTFRGSLLLEVVIIGEYLLLGGRYYWGVVAIRGRYFQGVVIIGRSLLPGGRYYRGIVTIGRSLLSDFYGIS